MHKQFRTKTGVIEVKYNGLADLQALKYYTTTVNNKFSEKCAYRDRN